MGSRLGARKLALRWAPRVAVLVGLAGLLVVGWQYSQYVSIFGDDPCRSRGFCDERAIALARRGLSRWYLGSVALVALGLVVTLVRRSWHRGDSGVADESMGAARHAGLAGLLTFAWLGWLAASFVFWLFGGAPFVIAVAVTWGNPARLGGGRRRHRGRGARRSCSARAVRGAMGLPSGAPRGDGRESLRSLRAEFTPVVLAATSSRAAPEPIPPPPGPAPTASPTTRHTQTPMEAARPCGPTDLTLEATSWDSAMGTSAVTIVATNQSASACWVEGYPGLRLLQGGHDLRLKVGHPVSGASGQDLTVARIGVRPGVGASFGWWWKGYRQMADQETPQTVVLGLSGGNEVRLELPGDPYLVDVIEDAAVDITPWQPMDSR